ncbi:MAG TPA: nitroreductase family protein [Candidatus Brocadiia bacterium]|nr:nitroreductase family protein [Candidatus Brocadiia bacterium]
MDLWSVLNTRRSVRSFSPRPVSSEAIERALEAARAAPSANNIQPWKFIVVRSASSRLRIAELSAGQMFIAEAPVVIVCCVRRYRDEYSWLQERMCLVDGSIAFTHLILAARAEGLGTCWIGAFSHDELKRHLGVPGDYDILALTPLGFPKDENAFRPVVDRKPFEDVVFLDHFGGEME